MNPIKHTVLLVDGSKTFQVLVKAMLGESNFRLIICHSGQEALEQIKRESVDFICSAYHLKDMDGIALCQKIRILPRFSHKPFALLTSKSLKGTQALPAGVTEVFKKTDLQELCAFIKHFPYLSDKLSGSILYVEDTRSQREMVSSMMSGFGLHVDAFASAEEALPYFIKHHYDVIVTDIVLSGSMSGAHFVNRIRRQSSSKGYTPILTLTAFDDPSRRMELVNLGITDYLVKPFDEMDLFVRINHLLGNKRLQTKLIEQEQYYRLSFEHILIGMAKVTLDGRFLYVNRYLSNFMGYSREEMLTFSFRDITHPDDLPHSLACMEQLINGELETCTQEKRYLHKNGQVLWGSLSVAVQRDVNGKALFFISVLQNITEAKALQDKITESCDQYNHILATTSDGFWLVGNTGQIEDVNDAYVRLSGYSRDELLAMSISDLEASETPDQTRKHITKIIREKQGLFETQHRTKEGQLIDLEVSVTYQESTGQFVSFLRDIGVRKKILHQEMVARKEAEVSLQRAIKAERELLKIYEDTHRNIGQELHDDVGQQITAIALLSEIMTQDLIKEENPLRHNSQKITDRLNQAVSRVRQLSHELCPVISDYDHLIDMLQSLTDETMGIHGTICTFHYDKNPLAIGYFDYGEIPAQEFNIQLFRIAQEAITNVIKHSRASQIELLLRHGDNGDVLEIVDNGVSLSEQHATGLGMYSMTFRAKMINADIAFISRETGGLCVSICLPRAGNQKNQGRET